MILDLPFGNTEHLGQLVGRQARADQQFNHALARCAWRNEHGVIVGESAVELKRNLADAKVVLLVNCYFESPPERGPRFL